HGAINENAGGLKIEAVGEDALQFAECGRVEFDVIVGRGETQSAVAAGADDGGIGGSWFG
ncbi:MAG: hypothetical protein WCL71_16465, partial [Deltaproteobacteria bacterium]